METICCVENCGLPKVGNLYNGRPYCKQHYNDKLFGDFSSEYQAWPIGKEPSARMKSLFGRMLEEVWDIRCDGLMTKARIRDRGFNFFKAPNGFTFEITRHPNAIKDGYVSELIVQKWHVNATDGYFKKISERPWTDNDPD